jgi:hypothetical protein
VEIGWPVNQAEEKLKGLLLWGKRDVYIFVLVKYLDFFLAEKPFE